MPEKRKRGRPKGSVKKPIKITKTRARRLVPLTPEEVQKTPIATVREEYNKLAEDYMKIMERDLIYCFSCDEFHARSAFYEDKRFGCGVYPECKDSLKKQAMDYDKKTDTYKDNKEKTIEVFRKLDIPFIQSIYDRAITALEEDAEGRGIRGGTAFGSTLTTVKSLPPYSEWGFAQSQYDDTDIYVAEERREAREEIKKLFGEGLTESDYIYLQDQFDDWNARVQIDSKAQETLMIQICFAQMNLWKAQKSGQSTKDLVKTLNELMDAARLQPKQNVANAANDSLSFGQLIEKWEQEEPIPEPSPEFKDVDGIGKYIRVWFFGHLCKAIGVKNAYSKEYDEEVGKYTVERTSEQEDLESGEIYEKLFGKAEE